MYLMKFHSLNSTERAVLPLLAKDEASIKYQKSVVMKISEPSPLLVSSTRIKIIMFCSAIATEYS